MAGLSIYFQDGDRSDALQAAFNKSVASARARGLGTTDQQRDAIQSTLDAITREQQRNVQEGDSSGRSQAAATAAYQPSIDQLTNIIDQRDQMASLIQSGVLSGGAVPVKSDFTGFEDGLFGLNIGATQRRDIDPNFLKVRELVGPKQYAELSNKLGLDIKDYADFAGEFKKANPGLSEQIGFPSEPIVPLGVALIEGLGEKLFDTGAGLGPALDAVFPGISDVAAEVGTAVKDLPKNVGTGLVDMSKDVLGLKDDNPVKGEVRNVLGVKKNTPEDMVESSDVFDMATEDRNPGIADANLLGGTQISQALRGNEDLSRFINPDTGRTISNVKPQFQNLNLGQFQNMIRDKTGYFDRVINKLGLGGR